MENFYVFYGDDVSSLKHEVDDTIQKFKDADVVSYDMSSTDLADVIRDASMVSMFGSRKVLILEDCFFLTANKSVSSLDMLEEYLNHYNSDNILIFMVYNEKVDTRKKVVKLLSSHKMIAVKKSVGSELEQYVFSYLKEHNYKMNDISYFLKYVGSNLFNIKNELDKLMMYKIDTKIIGNDDIDKVCIEENEDEIFSLTDAIFDKDVVNSLHLLEVFLNKSYDEMQIIMLLASQFRFLFQVKRLSLKNKSEREIAQILGANPFRVKFVLKKVYRYTEEAILDYIKKIAKMDYDIKFGILDKRLALQLFIVTNC